MIKLLVKFKYSLTGFTLLQYSWFFRKKSRMLRYENNLNLIVDGYPRAANTYVAHFIELSYPSVRFNHHIHNVCAVELALRRGQVAIVLFRNPYEQIVSAYNYRRFSSLMYEVELWKTYYLRVIELKKSYQNLYIWNFQEIKIDFNLFKERIEKILGRADLIVSDERVKMSLKEMNRNMGMSSNQNSLPTGEKRYQNAQILDSELSEIYHVLTTLSSEE